MKRCKKINNGNYANIKYKKNFRPPIAQGRRTEEIKEGRPQGLVDSEPMTQAHPNF